MTELLRLVRVWVDGLHFQQLQFFGGLYGTRDEGAVESALARPRHKWEHDEERDISILAAAYGYGLARNHGYVDGNKRVGFVAMAAFLDLNGYALEADEADVVRVMNAVAAGEMGEAAFAEWVRAHTVEPGG